jgi:hypothetical protein
MDNLGEETHKITAEVMGPSLGESIGIITELLDQGSEGRGRNHHKDWTRILGEWE